MCASEVRWFGKAYGALYEQDMPHTDTPVGVACRLCDEPIADSDDGFMVQVRQGDWLDVPEHYECHLRRVIGGLNHLKGRCICCGGTEPPDPPELSKREAAKAAVDEYNSRRTPMRPLPQRGH
jgi:hypothetical protein